MKSEKLKAIKRRRLGPLAYEVIDRASNRVLGCYGGRDGMKWALTADGATITTDSPLSVGALIGRIISESKTV